MDDLRRKLERMQRNIERIDGRHSITEILNPAFMRSNTPFANFEAMCAAIGVHSAEEFTALPDDEWETHVRTTTRFQSWEEMQQAAAGAWAQTRLTEGL
jgi:hypothetical protein